MQRPDDRVLEHLCMYHLGIGPSETNIAQLRTYFDAFAVFVERDGVRGGLWQEGGAEDSAGHCLSKARRLRNHVERVEGERDRWEEQTDQHREDCPTDEPMLIEAEDDGVDLINYAVFYVRNLRAGRLTEASR